MGFFRQLAYSTYLGPFPTLAWVGMITYVLVVSTAIIAAGKKWSRRLRRVPVKVHRGLAIIAVLLATLHLMMGLSRYV
jgi:hypothetical protein